MPQLYLQIIYVSFLCCNLFANVTENKSDIGDYFGFEDVEIIKIGDDPGPMYTADINSDGLVDILVINNRKSRIDVLLQKKGASPDDEVSVTRANEIPAHWRFNKERIMVSHQIAALTLHDFNNDGRTDLIYASNPNTIVFLAQNSDGEFVKSRIHRVKNLNANRNAFMVSNIIDDDSPELLTVQSGNVQIYPLDGDSLGKPTILATEDRVVAFELADFDGNGTDDISAIVPDSSEPVRLWLSQTNNNTTVMGPQLRFDLPVLREFASITLPNSLKAKMAIIERASRRIVLYEVDRQQVITTGDREAPIEIYPFLGEGNRKVLIIDANSDGLLDIVATNATDNTMVIYQQIQGKGLSSGYSSPTLTDVNSIATGDINGDSSEELFVLSEEEGVVGRSVLGKLDLDFPQPVPFSQGNTPVSLSTVTLNGEEKVAVISKEKRNYTIDLIDDSIFASIELGSLSRAPDQIIGFDADQDDNTDLLLITRDKPMKLVHAEGENFKVLDDTDMGQYGLVRDASEINTTLLDVDNDGNDELLIAGNNFVRAVRYEPNPQSGVSPGWQVVSQVNLEDGSSDLISITTNGTDLFVADKENERIVRIIKDSEGSWIEGDSLFVHGYDLGPIYTGDFTGDNSDDIVAISDAGFAVIQIEGTRITLNEIQSWRSDNERRVQHELAIGDVNADGYSDMISLDAGEQMLEIFTFSKKEKMIYATGFKIYESRIFSGGEPREWQPSQVIISDLTNDDKEDVLLLSHDRLILYRQ